MPKIVYESNSTKSAKEFAKVQLKRYKVKTVFTLVRKNSNWDGVGSYPLLSAVLSAAVEMKIAITRRDILTIIHLDPEFKKVKSTSEIVEALYSSLTSSVIPSIQARIKVRSDRRTRLSVNSDTLLISHIKNQNLASAQLKEERR